MKIFTPLYKSNLDSLIGKNLIGYCIKKNIPYLKTKTGYYTIRSIGAGHDRPRYFMVTRSLNPMDKIQDFPPIEVDSVTQKNGRIRLNSFKEWMDLDFSGKKLIVSMSE